VVNTHRYLAGGALVLAIVIAAPACATGAYYGARPGVDYRDMDRWAYENGLRDGRQHGERDARARRSYRVDRDREYRVADNGFYRRGGYPLYQYQQMFRQGYEVGYDQGYARWARTAGPGRVRPGIVPPYGATGGYSGAPASRNGYTDGLEAGREDARAGRTFDPRRPKRYREGDHNYSSRDGSLEDYKRDYRAAFQQGYERGYRESRR
jgi:hypothetical protein